jgi:hypothetical protein
MSDRNADANKTLEEKTGIILEPGEEIISRAGGIKVIRRLIADLARANAALTATNKRLPELMIQVETLRLKNAEQAKRIAELEKYCDTCKWLKTLEDHYNEAGYDMPKM